MRIIQGILACVGRLMISTIFLLSALGNKITNFSSVADVMASEGMPQDEILGIPAHKYLLCGAIIFLILGGLSVAAGLKARLGACMLFLFLIGATYYFHDFWNAEADQQPAEMIQFLKNLALGGTMLFIIANGAGPGSLDHRKKSKTASNAFAHRMSSLSLANQPYTLTSPLAYRRHPAQALECPLLHAS